MDTSFHFSLHNNSSFVKLDYSVKEYEENNFTIHSIRLSDSNNNINQIIIDTTDYLGKFGRGMLEKKPILKIIDINFDGYSDFRIRNKVSGRMQTPNYEYYLFNPQINQFVYNKEFSKLCCNLSLNNELKEIYIENYTWQEEKWEKWIYKVNNNIPRLSSKITEYVFDEDNKQKFRTVIEKNIDGVMKVISDTVKWKGM